MSLEFPQPAIERVSDRKETLSERSGEFLGMASELGLLGDKAVDMAATERFDTGVRSVVYKVAFEDGERAVVKMISEERSLAADVTFFSRCREAGIRVPDVWAEHEPTEDLPVSLMVMGFVSEPLLSQSTEEELIQGGKLREMGRIQARLHAITGSGFGRLDANGQGVSGSLKEEMEGGPMDLWKKVAELEVQGLLDVSHEDVERALELLGSSVRPDATSLTHNDLMPSNVFITDPLTIFDPHPRLTHPYNCLATTLARTLVQENGEARAREILAGYQEVAAPVDREQLEAAMVLQRVFRSHAWARKEELRGNIERLRAASVPLS